MWPHFSIHITAANRSPIARIMTLTDCIVYDGCLTSLSGKFRLCILLWFKVSTTDWNNLKELSSEENSIFIEEQLHVDDVCSITFVSYMDYWGLGKHGSLFSALHLSGSCLIMQFSSIKMNWAELQYCTQPMAGVGALFLSCCHVFVALDNPFNKIQQ